MNILHNHKDSGHLLHCMCYLTQFIISCLIIDTQAAALSKIFMEQVIFNFGMVAVVLVDTDNRFRITFEDMYKILKLTFWRTKGVIAWSDTIASLTNHR